MTTEDDIRKRKLMELRNHALAIQGAQAGVPTVPEPMMEDQGLPALPQPAVTPQRPQVQAPQSMQQYPYVMAEQYTAQAAPPPDPTAGMGPWKKALWQGLEGAGMAGALSNTPGGYAGHLQQQQQNERQRQQDLLNRARELRGEGFQQSQAYRQDVNAQLTSEQQEREFQLNEREFQSEDAERKARIDALKMPRTDTSMTDTELYMKDPAAYERKARLDASMRPVPQGPQPRYEWVLRNGKPLQIPLGSAQPGDAPYRAAAPENELTALYSDEQAMRATSMIDDIMGRVDHFNTGFGTLVDWVPYTSATRMTGDIEALKTTIFTNELAKMRAASRTGGALGNVSDTEARILGNALGSLNPAAGPDVFKQQLQVVKDSIARWNTAVQAYYQGTRGAGEPPNERPIDEDTIRRGMAANPGASRQDIIDAIRASGR